MRINPLNVFEGQFFSLEARYSKNPKFKERLLMLEKQMDDLPYKESRDCRKEYVDLVTRYGAATNQSFVFMRALENAKKYDTMQEMLPYYDSQLASVFHETAMWEALNMNLDNGIAREIEESPSEGESDMASQYRETYVYTDKDGTEKTVRMNGKNKRETDKKFQEFLQDNVREDEKTKKCTVLFKPYVEEWLQLYKDGKVKKSTTETYRKNLKAHLYPAFENMLLTEITTPVVQAFLNERKDLSEKTLKMLMALLGQIMKSALEDKHITEDPTASTRIIIPSKKKEERVALPLGRFKQIIQGLHSLELTDRRYLALILLTGMRRGEALGLRWEDIDVENGMLHVRRGVTHPQQNQPNIEDLPKTKSGVRDIPLDPMLIEFLSPLGQEGFIVGGNEPFSLSSFRAMWKRIQKSIDLKDVTSHVFRHSYLTYAAGETTDLKTLQALAGHSTIQMTMDHYVHVQPEKLKELGNKMHNLFAQ